MDGQPNCMHTKSDASEGGAYIEDIPDLPKLSDIGKKKKTNKAGLYNLLALLINETLTPNFFNKVSNSDADTLKSPIKVVETQGKIVDGQPNCMHTKSDASEGGAYIEDISDLPKLSDIGDEEKDK